jgi:hypothetical protein
MNDKKLLFLDIEWAPALVYTFDMWNSNSSPEKIVDHGGMLCFCAHWDGSKEFLFFSLWEDGQVKMAEAAKALLDEANAVVTYNGDKYDLPKIRGEILLAGLTPPAPVPSIDVIRTIKGFGFNMNRLAYIGPLLKIGGKIKHEGFALWKDVMDGKESAQKKMRRYCIQDVRLLARLYNKVRPFIKTHPHLGREKHECANCGSKEHQKRGFYRSKFFETQRLFCKHCGAWSLGTRRKIK